MAKLLRDSERGGRGAKRGSVLRGDQFPPED